MDFNKIRNEISDLFDECLKTTKPFHIKLDLFLVPINLVEKVLSSTGVDITNHWVCIDNFGIIHTLHQHGNPISETKRGQIAVENEDIINFFEIFLEPDDIKLVGQTKHTNLNLIQFSKTIDQKKYVIKEVRTPEKNRKNKKSRIVFHTMYKIKADK